MKHADPLAQRRIEQLEAERDELRAKVARVRKLLESDDMDRYGHVHPEGWGEPDCAGCWVADIRNALAGPQDAPLPPSEPSSLPDAPGTPNDATGGAE